MTVAVPAQHEARGAAVMRTLPNIAKEWRLSGPDMAHLLGAADSTYRRWKARPETARLDANQFERASYVLGIYKALKLLLPDQTAIDHWLHTRNANPVFNGQAPIDRLKAGKMGDLFVVRQYLDASRGW
ncbi:antitoxin Xre-like helix-turn-helix domain-containing protein [Halomonas sp. HP20-15]|uniref:antitoxin Xre-like helix-turn-helix domain-containing protein n=1 Tax=Halomonas sp. HP20-15 TaxID=3085901 RepID=UPI0029812544|nr:antitoxin Xre-like helix-turn-helix domain-containing protein [Halomonas sp. HP20-15]MDW5377354.1 antitoxin Xre-like helix-turn-helix domain-containing protein [Halomonas sp. HP20-15]